MCTSDSPECNPLSLLAYLILKDDPLGEEAETDKAMGKAKEAYGALTGDGGLKGRGQG